MFLVLFLAKKLFAVHFLVERFLNTMPVVVQRERNFTCFKCFLVIKGPYEALTKHFRQQHGFKTAGKERNDALFCGQNGCTQKVNSFSNFRYHLSVCEKNVDLEMDVDNNIETQHQVEPMEQDISAEAGFDHDFEGMPIIPDDSVSVSVGKILLKLSAHFNVTETAINFLTKNLLDTFMHCDPCSKTEIVESLQKLSTTFKRNKFFTKHLNYVSPEEIYFGSEEKQIRNHALLKKRTFSGN